MHPAAADDILRRLRRSRWAERSVQELSGSVREITYQERWTSPKRGPLQRRAASGKWIAALVLLTTAGLLRHSVTLAVVVVGVLVGSAATGLPPLALLRRAAPLGAPFLVLILLVLVFPAAGGWHAALRLALRLLASALIALVLVMTTRWTDLTTGLRRLGIPPLFVAVLEQTRLHLVQLPLTAEEMFQARRSRTVGVAGAAEARRFVGQSMGALLGKTQANAEARHAAMLARGYGYHGAARLRADEGATPRWTAADLALVAGALISAAVLIGVDHHLGGIL